MNKIIQGDFQICISVPLMFLTNFIFVASYLKMHPAVHLNTLKALTYRSQKEKFKFKLKVY